MDKTPPNSSSSQKEVFLENKDGELGGSSSSETKLDVSEQPGSTSERNERSVEISVEPAGRTSPEPSCAICLETLQNKSFTNSCLHMFCFKCLVAWSKIKPECPLCKQQFKSIIHNVQEGFQYDTYHIRNGSTETYWNLATTRDHSYGSSSSTTLQTSASERRFRYRTTLTSERYVSRNNSLQQDNSALMQMATMQLQIERHRMRYAPHSVSIMTTSQTTNQRGAHYRRRIYSRHLYGRLPERSSNRVRLASPEFFNRNPACTHRLIPWLNRELSVLLHNDESQIAYVLELIMALITRYEIQSAEFFLHIQPYTTKYTAHFVHEFFCFASSPYDIDEYDRHVQYDVASAHSRPSPASDSSPSEDHTIDIESVEITSENTSISQTNDSSKSNNTSTSSTTIKKNNVSRVNPFSKMIFKRNRNTDSWVTVMGPLPLMHNYNNVNNYFSNPGPSTSSGLNTRNFSLYNAPSMSISPLRVSSDDDECLIVDEVKPKKERTPEIIDLSSDDEVSPIANAEGSSNDNNEINVEDSDSNSIFPPRRLSSISPVYDFSSDNSRTSSPRKRNSVGGSSNGNDINVEDVDSKSIVPSPDSSQHEPTSPIFDVNSDSSHIISSLKRSDSSSSIECIYTYNPSTDTPPNGEKSPSHVSAFERNSPIDLSNRKATKRKFSHISVIKETSAFKNRRRSSDLSEQPSTSKSSSDIKESHSKSESRLHLNLKSSLPSKIVVPNPSTSQRSSHWDTHSVGRNSSTIYLSDSSDVSPDSHPSRPKKVKLKLKSVIAHFSCEKNGEKSDSSMVRSSHKKKKEKKKKKKKHSNRKHKGRIYSDTESSS